jgi:hypothetical protein
MGTTLASAVALYGLADAWYHGELEIPGLKMGSIERQENKASAH